ncbi:hypothetical protein AMAG_20229 [Allomyces macrogynus ATCC 38327]|uniref:Uncharacterized protein n=1 Tax=Allomyces macrogynus (strain ATCC 38327) TaxID=578462 RepID=A0A0L0T5J7_ALLM3|nr:hypothetical protein AMAG_20229 [Allomyces macrogynus ATCC 38327]|eukprot:KNE70068.1 hypothetical protein AMAG_20229 [Allomyces macrogynus ATCC 38327]
MRTSDLTEPGSTTTTTTETKIVSPLQAERVIAAAAAQGIRVAPVKVVDREMLREVRITNMSPEDLEMLVTRAQGEVTERRDQDDLDDESV